MSPAQEGDGLAGLNNKLVFKIACPYEVPIRNLEDDLGVEMDIVNSEETGKSDFSVRFTPIKAKTDDNKIDITRLGIENSKLYFDLLKSGEDREVEVVLYNPLSNNVIYRDKIDVKDNISRIERKIDSNNASRHLWLIVKDGIAINKYMVLNN